MGKLLVMTRHVPQPPEDVTADDVRELLDLLQMTEQSLAEWLRVSVSAVGRWKRGNRKARGIYRELLRKALEDARSSVALRRRAEQSA